MVSPTTPATQGPKNQGIGYIVIEPTCVQPYTQVDSFSREVWDSEVFQRFQKTERHVGYVAGMLDPVPDWEPGNA